MKALIDLSVDHARTVMMLLVLLVLSGLFAYTEIPREADPEVDIPVLDVTVPLDGISPSDADRMLVAPLQKELGVVEGLQSMHSVAYEGGATVSLEFDAGFDVEQARRDVREAVTRSQSNLPQAIGTPEVVEINTSQFPQLVIALGGQIAERTLYQLADDLKQSLDSSPGVHEVMVKGKREEMVEIIVDPVVLESYRVSQFDLVNAVEKNNKQVAAGVVDSGIGRYSLKVPGVIETADELMQLPLKTVEGKVVRMRDIAQVRRVYKDATSIARAQGQPAVTLEIKKRSSANVVDMIEGVKQRVTEQQLDWPTSLEVSYFGDKSVEISNVLNDLENNVLIAVLVVVVVILAYMGVRSAILVAVAIPGSFVIGMLVIEMMGLTINIVVLFSLIMSVGILVDGAIVITENADRRLIAGLNRIDAYKQSAKRMAWPIVASIATTLAAFLPLLFWPGVVGEFMKYLPITLIAILTASLLMALLFVPTLGSVIGKPRNLSEKTVAIMSIAKQGRLSSLKGSLGVYIKLLSWAVLHPGTILLFIIAMLLTIAGAYQKWGHGTEYFPEVEPTQAVLTLLARGDLSIYERDDILRKVESEVLNIEEIKTTYATTSVVDNEAIAFITLEFFDWNQRERRVDQVLLQLRKLENSVPGLRLEIQKLGAGPGGDSKPVQIAFSSTVDADAMQTVRRVRQWMVEHGGFTDIEDSLPQPGLEWVVEVNREEAGRYGADVSLVGSFVQLVTNGLKISTYRPDNSSEELDIRLRFPPDLRQLSQLHDMRVPTEYGYVPLSHFATIEPRQKVISIRRLDGKAVHRVLAAPKLRANEDFVNMGQLANTRLDELYDAVEAMDKIPGVDLVFEGQEGDQKESQLFLIKAMGVAVFIIAIILVTQFNSFYQAALILTAVILSMGGVFLGLLIVGEAFGVIMSGVGIIALAGIVVNNNIVLIDTYNQLVKYGVPVQDAAVRAGVLRLRPVLLTTITTVLGLMPMVLQISVDLFHREISIGSPSTQWWSQLATAIVGGLSFATVLTLVLTPALLVLPSLYKANREIRRLRRAG